MENCTRIKVIKKEKNIHICGNRNRKRNGINNKKFKRWRVKEN